MSAANPHAPRSFSDEDSISLCETLDRVLNKGVVVAGEVVISVADIDLIYLGLQLMLTSVETAKTAGLGLTNVLNERHALRPFDKLRSTSSRPEPIEGRAGQAPFDKLTAPSGVEGSNAARSCP